MTHGKLDWQETEDFIEEFATRLEVPSGSPFLESVTFDMHPWQGVLILSTPAANTDHEIEVFHGIDDSLGGGAGFTEIMHFRANEAGSLYIPAQGQTLQVSGTKVGLADDTWTVRTARTTRRTDRRFFHPEQPLLSVQSTPAAGTTNTHNFAYPYAGPAVLSFFTNANDWNLRLRGTERDGTGHTWCQLNDIGLEQAVSVIEVPPLINEIQVQNNDGAARTFDIRITPRW